MTDIWQRLAAHRAETDDRPIAALFDADPDRARRCTVAADGLWFDWSKTAIDDTALDLLLALAEGVPARREAMFTGEKINETENRAVLHTALRASALPRFALYPWSAGREHSEAELQRLEAAGIEAVLLVHHFF